MLRKISAFFHGNYKNLLVFHRQHFPLLPHRTAPRSRPALCALLPGCEHLHNAVSYPTLLVPVPSNWTHAFRLCLTSSSSSLFVQQIIVWNRMRIAHHSALWATAEQFWHSKDFIREINWYIYKYQKISIHFWWIEVNLSNCVFVIIYYLLLKVLLFIIAIIFNSYKYF